MLPASLAVKLKLASALFVAAGGVDVSVVSGGVLSTVKLVALSAVPAGLLTLIGPVVAPAGTVAVICVSELAVNVVAAVPLNATAVVPVNPLPVMVTTVSVRPIVGVKEGIAGATITMKLAALNAVPAGLVTLMGPVLAPAGTVARICVLESTVNVVAAVPLNATAPVPLNPVPVRVTCVPTTPLVGTNEVIAGATMTVKTAALAAVPAGLVTLIGPLVAPPGETARICELESTVNDMAGVPLNVTAVVPVNPLPVRVTSVPTGPLFGVNEVIVGATITVKSARLWVVPDGFVTLIFPVAPPVGTVAVIWVSELMVKTADVPPNFTDVASVNRLPDMVTCVPTGPLVGLNEVITGPPVEASGR